MMVGRNPAAAAAAAAKRIGKREMLEINSKGSCLCSYILGSKKRIPSRHLDVLLSKSMQW
jgi:hypothetical protein